MVVGSTWPLSAAGRASPKRVWPSLKLTMAKLSGLKSATQIAAEELRDPAVRAEVARRD